MTSRCFSRFVDECQNGISYARGGVALLCTGFVAMAVRTIKPPRALLTEEGEFRGCSIGGSL